MKKSLFTTILLSSFVVAGGDIAPVAPEEPVVATSPWLFEFEPYLMVTNIDGDAKFGRLPASELNVDFGTILENLDMGAMAHAEAHHNSGWGAWIDYSFMKLSNDIEPLDRITSLQLRQGVLEVAGLYRQTVSSGYIEYIAGIRWWDNDYDLNYNFPYLGAAGTIDKEVDWIDGFIGARYTHIINENWKLRVHGDIGAGGADFTAGVSAGVIYTINDLIDIDVKYKATWVDYKEGTEGQRDYFVYDTVTHGAIIGINFKF